jgi:hypothetical protein
MAYVMALEFKCVIHSSLGNCFYFVSHSPLANAQGIERASGCSQSLTRQGAHDHIAKNSALGIVHECREVEDSVLLHQELLLGNAGQAEHHVTAIAANLQDEAAKEHLKATDQELSIDREVGGDCLQSLSPGDGCGGGDGGSGSDHGVGAEWVRVNEHGVGAEGVRVNEHGVGVELLLADVVYECCLCLRCWSLHLNLNFRGLNDVEVDLDAGVGNRGSLNGLFPHNDAEFSDDNRIHSVESGVEDVDGRVGAGRHPSTSQDLDNVVLVVGVVVFEKDVANLHSA